MSGDCHRPLKSIEHEAAMHGSYSLVIGVRGLAQCLALLRVLLSRVGALGTRKWTLVCGHVKDGQWNPEINHVVVP